MGHLARAVRTPAFLFDPRMTRVVQLVKRNQPLDSVAGNTLIGMLTRLILRKPFHVARAAICQVYRYGAREVAAGMGRCPAVQTPDESPGGFKLDVGVAPGLKGEREVGRGARKAHRH